MMNDTEMSDISQPLAGIPVAEMKQLAARKGLLLDVRGDRYYVAVNPRYGASPRQYKRVLAVRASLCVVTVVVTALVTVGQCVDFAHGQYGKMHYTVWFYSVTGSCNTAPSDYYFVERKLFAAATAFFGLMSFVVSCMYVAAWAKDERARELEREANAKLQCAYGVEQVDVEDSSELTFPFANTRLENHGLVPTVPMEEAERQRCKKDNDTGVALFSMLAVTAVCAAISVGLMADPRGVDFTCDDDKSRLNTGFALFVVALVLAVVAFILLAVPHLTRLYLCHMPPPRRCQLMLVDVNRPAANARGPGRVQDRLYAHAGLPAALPGPAPRATGREDPPPSLPLELERHRVLRSKDTADPPTRYVNVSGNYTTADYYTAPPPLFSVEQTDDAAKQKEEQAIWKQVDSHTRE